MFKNGEDIVYIVSAEENNAAIAARKKGETVKKCLVSYNAIKNNTTLSSFDDDFDE